MFILLVRWFELLECSINRILIEVSWLKDDRSFKVNRKSNRKMIIEYASESRTYVRVKEVWKGRLGVIDS